MASDCLAFICYTIVAMEPGGTVVSVLSYPWRAKDRVTEGMECYCSRSYPSLSLTVFISDSYTLSFGDVNCYVIHHVVFMTFFGLKKIMSLYIFFPDNFQCDAGEKDSPACWYSLFSLAFKVVCFCIFRDVDHTWGSPNGIYMSRSLFCYATGCDSLWYNFSNYLLPSKDHSNSNSRYFFLRICTVHCDRFSSFLASHPIFLFCFCSQPPGSPSTYSADLETSSTLNVLFVLSCTTFDRHHLSSFLATTPSSPYFVPRIIFPRDFEHYHDVVVPLCLAFPSDLII